MTSNIVCVVGLKWREMCSLMSLPQPLIESFWHELASRYSEPHRHYHTLEHILDMLEKRKELQAMVTDHISVDLAIFFHDVIYNPQSGSNEEDSAGLFKQLFVPLALPLVNISKVDFYILATKQHNVFQSNDEDLKLFIDIDMSILGSPLFSDSEFYPSDCCKNLSLPYSMYADRIRSEYCHIDDLTYCMSRAKFLKQVVDTTITMPPDTDTTAGAFKCDSDSPNPTESLKKLPIFASSVGFAKWEAKARENILWEICQLDHRIHAMTL